MADRISQEQRSDLMRKIRSTNTSPELKVRKFLFSRGFRYRLYAKNLPGKPDIILKKYKTVIFINGCFWHGHKCKIGSGNRIPKTNSIYWKEKINKNIKRDKSNKVKIKNLGWTIITIWECQTKKEALIKNKLSVLMGMRSNG